MAQNHEKVCCIRNCRQELKLVIHESIEESPVIREHSRILGVHSNKLEEHSRILNQHSVQLDEHSRILNEHTAKLDEHSAKLEEHSIKLDQLSRKLDEHIADTRKNFAEIREELRKQAILNEERDRKIDTIYEVVLSMVRQLEEMLSYSRRVDRQEDDLDITKSVLSSHIKNREIHVQRKRGRPKGAVSK